MTNISLLISPLGITELNDNDMSYYNPFDNPSLLEKHPLMPKSGVLGSYKETPRYTVECPCGTTIKGYDTFNCANCKRTFELSVDRQLNKFDSIHSYDELYEAFLVSPSENELGYNQTALDALLAAVTPTTELYSGRSLVEQKKGPSFRYYFLLMAVMFFCVGLPILLHI